VSNIGVGADTDATIRVARSGSKIRGFLNGGFDSAFGITTTDGGGGAPPPAPTFFLLLESGSDRVLLETGDRLVKEDG